MKVINIGEQFPNVYQTVLKLDKQIEVLVRDSCFSLGFVHLLRLRASQINQCAFCVRFHSIDAQKHGESFERISLTSAWRECQHFTDEERSALALTEAVTLIHDQQELHRAHNQATEVLSDSDISLVEWVAVVTNSLNRIAISSSYAVTPE